MPFTGNQGSFWVGAQPMRDKAEPRPRMIPSNGYWLSRRNSVWSLALWSRNHFIAAHDDVIKWKHFLSYWPFVRGITGHRWIPHKKASDAELWCFLWSAHWIIGSVNNCEAGEFRCHRAHYDIIVMKYSSQWNYSELWAQPYRWLSARLQ